MCIGKWPVVNSSNEQERKNKNKKKSKKCRGKENKILMLHGTGKEINKNLFFS